MITGAPWIIRTPQQGNFPSSISLSSSSSYLSASPASFPLLVLTDFEDFEVGYNGLLLQGQIDVDVITGGEEAVCPVLGEEEDPFDIIHEIISTFQNKN